MKPTKTQMIKAQIKKALISTALLTLSVGANAQSIEFSNPSGIAKPFGYTHVVSVPTGQKTIYISGQLGFLPDGKLAGKKGDFKAQAHQAFANIQTALESVGAKWENVVKINMYMTDIDSQISDLREVRDSFVNTKAPPASTTVEVPRLVVKDALFEIDAVVVLP